MRMICLCCLFAVCGMSSAFADCADLSDPAFKTLPVDTFLDKMKAAWLGQMAGVGWGGPTEFNFNGRIIPEKDMPKWTPDMINQYAQDDIYVEMTFVRTLEQHGWDVSLRQAGIDFANSGYELWHANKFGRKNLRAGIAPPDSGHPQFNSHADDIDYQIEADFSGIIAPGGEGGAHLVADRPQAGLAANGRPDQSEIPNNHFAYAVQWFVFAATALVIYGLALRKRMRGE